MGMTITEKIIAAHAGAGQVVPGQIVEADIDFAFGNDITAPLAIAEFEKAGIQKVFDPAKIGLIPDHFTPNKDIKSAEQCRRLRQFAKKHKIENYFEVGRGGIEHVILPEMGFVRPGDLVVGADSHTCTYGALGAFSTGVGSTDLMAAMAIGKVWLKVPESIKFTYTGTLGKWVCGKDLILHTIGKIGVDGALYKAMEFTGQVIRALQMSDRFTICNMAIEAGAKSGIIQPDALTRAYSGMRGSAYRAYESDSDAEYSGTVDIDCSELEPQVSFPHLPSNARPVREAGDVVIDQVVIGSCTNGRIEDLSTAAGILRNRQVHPDVRVIIIPGSRAVALEAIRKGYHEIFIRAGAAVSTPTCGPCLGGHMGILAEGEKAISTTNRNFVGRMGHPKSEVYLASPAVAAATAVTGMITHPEDLK
ncbi:MAG: 3-isopropylmalate dehydratase large subunit [archaeon]